MKSSAILPVPVNNNNNNPVFPMKSPRKRTARRRLFSPPNHRLFDEWISKEIDEIRAQQRLKWGFQFDSENPCAASSQSDYIFTAVPAESVPSFYRTSFYPRESSPASDTENQIPCSSKTDVIATIACSDSDLLVLPTSRSSAASLACKFDVCDVCMYVRMYVCVCVCVCVYLYVCVKMCGIFWNSHVAHMFHHIVDM
ncbi:unnamed protein product [Gongylonema pulchrum]|uniref:CDI domain-containing protein n=1 Tax=Gongylonema pulchrum TaxID=637853 RepID=A0A183DTM9_9BILA|nr:unnamed protein product [Gongylonema pulchrum]